MLGQLCWSTVYDAGPTLGQGVVFARKSARFTGWLSFKAWKIISHTLKRMEM